MSCLVMVNWDIQFKRMISISNIKKELKENGFVLIKGFF